jgi:NAD(P)-dependent dehydrogenase (short-subunit alcohol dehydrogenase family)
LTYGRDDLEVVLNSNVIGVRNVTRALLPLLRNSQEKKVINISSALGSLSLTQAFSFSPSCAAYKVSKAALNMLTTQWAVSFKGDGIIVLSISPGVSVPFKNFQGSEAKNVHSILKQQWEI